MNKLLGLLTAIAKPDSLVKPSTVRAINQAASEDPTACMLRVGTASCGLDENTAAERLEETGPNVFGKEKKPSALSRLWDVIRDPLVLLLVFLAVVAFISGEKSSAIVIAVMVLLGVVLRFIQERKADSAAEKLNSLISTTVSVIREGKMEEIALRDLVPGDLVHLSAGDMIPADLRLLSAKDLFLNQAALTGESLPVEKTPDTDRSPNPYELKPILFMGSNVVSGAGTALVLVTGSGTHMGSIASSLGKVRTRTSFDKGISSFTRLMIGFMVIMAPLVFLLNGLARGAWFEAFLFALSVAVGLTPEMLPMIVTVNLSKGAISLSKKKVVVKRLNAIQDFGAMDVLCTDKTGTITEGRVVLERHLDIAGDSDEKVLRFAYINSFYQTGLRNLLDVAILQHVELRDGFVGSAGYTKIDELPFDFARRRMSVVVEKEGSRLLVCKGAVDEMLGCCAECELKGKVSPIDAEKRAQIQALAQSLGEDGYRVIALAYRGLPAQGHGPVYSVSDESGLVLSGFLAFLDPPKATAREALEKLRGHSVKVKVLTGDNDAVAASICRKVGISVERVVLGSEIESMSDEDLQKAVDTADVFARLMPAHKERIVKALRAKGHVVGFLGDGINDAPALKAADVGISVDTAVDVAKESSDIILLENSLTVLGEGVTEGRRVFGNMIKYVKMAASSSFGNMLSVLGASAFLPFVPMLPIQVLANNLLYDISQTAIPTDNVDEEWLSKPRRWDIAEIRRFILCFGPISSIFDYLTYFVMIRFFGCWTNPLLFHTGWFVESALSQALIIHVIRTSKIPFIQSRASAPLLWATLGAVAAAAFLPYSPVASALGLVALPGLYWAFLALVLLGYLGLTQLVKNRLNCRA